VDRKGSICFHIAESLIHGGFGGSQNLRRG
jgi:hypothetical protein